MNEDAIKDLCREFGWRPVDAEHRLEDWLRARLSRLERAEARLEELSDQSGKIETLRRANEGLEREDERLRDQLSDARANARGLCKALGLGESGGAST